MTNQITNSQKNVYLIPLAIIITGIIIAGAIIYTKVPQSSVGPSEKSEITQVAPPAQVAPSKEFTITEKDHVRGNFQAPVTIIEFSDFQCPFCQRFHPTVQQILDDYPNQVRWVYKHFPLDSIHSEARPSAEASECAAEQGKFWEFTDALFENQSRLGSNLYEELASQIGLNSSQFESCISSRKYKDKVEADYQEGIAAGVRGTPGGFINGRVIPGAVPYESLKAFVEQALTDLK